MKKVFFVLIVAALAATGCHTNNDNTGMNGQNSPAATGPMNNQGAPDTGGNPSNQ